MSQAVRLLTWIAVMADLALSWRSRGYLPHFDDGTRTQLVTYRLCDSLPPAVMANLRERAACYDRRRAEIDAWLDAGHGSCLLRNADAAQVVATGWGRFDGERYQLHAWCVMPNHVHVLVTPIGANRLAAIVQTQKSYTAKALLASWSAGLRPASRKAQTNAGGTPALPGRQIWQPEYHDRFIRSEFHFRSALAYIHDNPVKARLVARPELWLWSSAAASVPP